MEDPDVIARLYPLDEETGRAVRDSVHGEAVPVSWTEPTPGADASAQAFVLRFSRPPLNGFSFVFGRDRTVCDCVLPALAGVRGVHFAVTYDDFHRPTIEDLSTVEDSSATGTSVTYNGSGESRKGFKWIIGEDDFVLDKRIIVTASYATLEVVVSDHHATGAYDQGRALLASRRSGAPGLPTPTHPLLIRSLLGEGEFGKVHRVWDASSGDTYAEKTPKRSVPGQRNTHDAIRREVNVMRSVKHVSCFQPSGERKSSSVDPQQRHIAAFLEHLESPQETLCMEFARGGSLDQHPDLSADERVQVMTQLLSALSYLHGQSKAHRDIKTSNILVRYRGSGGAIDVMFGDFGLSSDDVRFKSNCGSHLYKAPELHQRRTKEFTSAIDIWSLGVVGLEICGRLPPWRRHHQTNVLNWCDDLVNSRGGLRELPVLRLMLVINPDSRSSAQQCLEIHEPGTSADWD